MSEQENPSDKTSQALAAVLVESVSSKQLPRLSDRNDGDDETPTLHQKCAPAMTDITTERHKHASRKMSSNNPRKRRDVSPAAKHITSMQTEIKMDEIVMMNTIQPIPLGPSVSHTTENRAENQKNEEKDDADSITSEIKELRTPEATKKTPEWSDEEEAGGLPRSESRASRSSRVTRVVRHLFCCGLQLEAPSEDNVSSPRESFFTSGI